MMKLLMNSRNQRGDMRVRIVSISSNGGAIWDTTYFDHTLIDPVNHAVCNMRLILSKPNQAHDIIKHIRIKTLFI